MSIREIAQLTFGKSIAEAEALELHNYFIATAPYIHAKTSTRRKVYYIGHRGSGKSALLTQLAHDFSQIRSNIIVHITPDEFSYARFKNHEHEHHDIRLVYGVVWHYALIITMFKAMTDHFDTHSYIKTNRANVKLLRSYLRQHEHVRGQGVFETFIDFLRHLDVELKLDTTGAGVNIKKKSPRTHIQDVSQLGQLRRELRAFDTVSNSYPLYIFIDELDTGWNNTREARHFLWGLFYAVGKIRQMSDVNVFVALRWDMFRDLQDDLPDAEKMRDDVEYFSWTPTTLKGLIGRRILTNWPSDRLREADLTSDAAVAEVFEHGVFEHMLGRTLHRPREIIQFCNDAVSEYATRVSMQQAVGDRIDKGIAESVAHRFSENRLNDLCKEYQHQYPSLKRLLGAFEGGKEYYSPESFNEALESAALNLSIGPQAVEWVEQYLSEPSRLAAILFEIGFLKFRFPNDTRFVAFHEKEILDQQQIREVKIHDLFTLVLKCRGRSDDYEADKRDPQT